MKSHILKSNNKNNKYQILIVSNINNKKRKKNIKRYISNDNKKYNTQKIPFTNIYNKLNCYNPLSYDLKRKRNKQSKFIKRNASSNDYSDIYKSNNVLQKNKNKSEYFYFSNNNKNNITDTLSFHKTNKSFPKSKSIYNENLTENNNIIINYFNDMEKYNKIIKKQNSNNLFYENQSKQNLYKHRKTNSCFNAPVLNKVAEINKKNPIYSYFKNNRNGKCNTENNKLINNNKYYIINKSDIRGKKIKKIINYNENKKKYTKINYKKEKMNNYCYDFGDLTSKSKRNHKINKDIINKIYSNSFQNNIISTNTYKKQQNYFYQNNSLNSFNPHYNSFLSNNLISAKKLLDYNSNNKHNNNIYSPVLINRINNLKFKKIPNSNTTNNKLTKNIIIYKNNNINQNNFIDYKIKINSLSTNYKNKQAVKDIEEPGTKLNTRNNKIKHINLLKSDKMYNKNKNILFHTNPKISNINNITNLIQKNNNQINYFNKDISKGNEEKNNNKYTSYNIPILKIKKENNHILSNISFSNNSSDKIINENNPQNIKNGTTNINQPINNNFMNINKYQNYNNNIRISSLFSILKEDKNQNNTNKNRIKSNEFRENENKIKNVEENRNKKNTKLETSFESLSDSKIYEIAKGYITKEDYLDKCEMEQILKNKKNYND